VGHIWKAVVREYADFGLALGASTSTVLLALVRCLPPAYLTHKRFAATSSKIKSHLCAYLELAQKMEDDTQNGQEMAYEPGNSLTMTRRCFE